MAVEAEPSEVVRAVMLEVSVDCRAVREESSVERVERVEVRARDWECRAGSWEVCCWMEVWRWVVKVEERWVRRASFSGLRGMGGAGRLVGCWVVLGRGRSKGESRREGAG